MTEPEKVQTDMKLEVVLFGVSDVDRAKTFSHMEEELHVLPR